MPARALPPRTPLSPRPSPAAVPHHSVFQRSPRRTPKLPREQGLGEPRPRAMAMRRSHAARVAVLLLGLLLAGCQGQLLAMQPSAVEIVSFDARRILASGPYYISYGSLNANRAPCPSGQGRSYYSANCEPTGGDAQPYVRTCDQITRCARG